MARTSFATSIPARGPARPRARSCVSVLPRSKLREPRRNPLRHAPRRPRTVSPAPAGRAVASAATRCTGALTRLPRSTSDPAGGCASRACRFRLPGRRPFSARSPLSPRAGAPPAARASSAPAARPPVAAPNRTAPPQQVSSARESQPQRRAQGLPIPGRELPSSRRLNALRPPWRRERPLRPRAPHPRGMLLSLRAAAPRRARRTGGAAGCSHRSRSRQRAPQRRPARPAASPRRRSRLPGSKAPGKASLPSSNVREVLAALDEPTGETRVMPAPALTPQTRRSDAHRHAGAALSGDAPRRRRRQDGRRRRFRQHLAAEAR